MTVPGSFRSDWLESAFSRRPIAAYRLLFDLEVPSLPIEVSLVLRVIELGLPFGTAKEEVKGGVLMYTKSGSYFRLHFLVSKLRFQSSNLRKNDAIKRTSSFFPPQTWSSSSLHFCLTSAIKPSNLAL